VVDADRLDRAGVHAPGFIALGAGVRRKSPFVMKGKNLDERSRRIERPGVLVRTGHFALETAGTFARIDV
jgi:hypothetical protein